MNAELLLDYFDRISDAPGTVPRLRRFILDLAVRGKLAEQDSNDEPASILLKRIQGAKGQVKMRGRGGKAKRIIDSDRDDALFPIPPGWEWSVICRVTANRGMRTPQSEFTYIDVTSINKETGSIADARVLRAADAPSRARKAVELGDVVYSCIRPYLLNVAVVESEITPIPIASTAFAVLNGFGLVIPRYLWIVLRSPFMVECVEGKMRGQAYPAIDDSDFAALPFPLPPFAEQRRIVAKVNELMALCDRLEVAQRQRESRRDLLAASAHHHLTNGAGGEAARIHAQFFINHLPRLTARPDQVKQLRQTILNLAVRGKLVPQMPDDEPAIELLMRIDAHKAQLVRARELKSQSIRTEALDSDSSHMEVPNNWLITHLGRIALSFRYGTSIKCSYERNGEPVLRIPNVAEGTVNLNDLKFGPVTSREADELRLRLGDILLVRSNGSLDLVGRAAPVGPDAVGYCYAGYLVRVRTCTEHLNTRYLVMALSSFEIRQQIEVPIRTTVGLKNVNSTEFANLTIPLPPFAEQGRIVTKVDEIMALCDQLEARLATARTEASRLLESVMHNALIPSSLEQLTEAN